MPLTTYTVRYIFTSINNKITAQKTIHLYLKTVKFRSSTEFGCTADCTAGTDADTGAVTSCCQTDNCNTDPSVTSNGKTVKSCWVRISPILFYVFSFVSSFISI